MSRAGNAFPRPRASRRVRPLPALAAALALLLLLAAPAQGVVPGLHASAAGTAAFADQNGQGGTACRAPAAVAFETDGSSGALAWTVPDCAGPDAAGVAAYVFDCFDVCRPQCRMATPDRVECDRADYWHDGWSVDHVTLDRDGAFTFQRIHHDGRTLDAAGTLLVLTWPAA